MIHCGQFHILGDMTRITVEVFVEPQRPADQSRNEWAEIRISAEAPEFRAGFDASMMFWELVSFREDLHRLHTNLSGEIVWSAIENFLDLKAAMDKLGHIHWSVELIRYHPTMTLNFEFESDQSYLPALIEQLDAILLEWRKSNAL